MVNHLACWWQATVGCVRVSGRSVGSYLRKVLNMLRGKMTLKRGERGESEKEKGGREV